MRILLVLLLAGVACAALWLLRPGSSPRPVPAGARPAPLEPSDSAPDEAPALVRPEPGEREPDTTAAPEPPPAPPAAGLEDGTRQVDGAFAQQYAGWSHVDKVERLIQLERELRGELDEAFASLFERGDYEIHPFDTSRRDGGGWDVLTQRAPEGLLGRGRSVLDPTPAGATTAATTGEYHFAVLDAGEFAGLYERVAERDWLRVDLSKRRP